MCEQVALLVVSHGLQLGLGALVGHAVAGVRAAAEAALTVQRLYRLEIHFITQANHYYSLQFLNFVIDTF